MEFVGKTVYYEQYKKGVVVAINKGRIQIKFDKINENCSFQFPQAFLGNNPRLSTTDEELLSYIKQDADKHVCQSCNKYIPDSKSDDLPPLVSLNGLMVCWDCRPKYHKCTNCGKYVLKDECEYVYDLKGEVCESCYKKLHVKCSECGEDIYVGDIPKSKYLPEGKILCYCCIEDMMLRCDSCEEFFLEEHITEVGDYRYCDYCVGKHSKKCKKCGELMIKDGPDLCRDCQKEEKNKSKKMELSEYMCKVVADLEYIIGSECYNPHSYDGWNDIEGCDYRYPISIRNSDGNLLKIYSNINDPLIHKMNKITPEAIKYMKYRFGANELFVGLGIIKVLKYLENRYDLDFNELENKLDIEKKK